MSRQRHEERLEELHEHEILRKLNRIEFLLVFGHFTLTLTQKQENPAMSLGNIAAGSSGTFAAQLLLNGQPYAPLAGAPVLDVTYSADDPDVVLDPSADTTSVVAEVPAASQDTELTVGASAVAPDGTTVTAQVNVIVTPAAPPAQVFSLKLDQTS
jgi:hypothetical protein